MYEILKDLGLCILSLLVKFVAFTANVLARKQPEHYQQVQSSYNGLYKHDNSKNHLEATWSFCGLPQNL